MLPQSCPLCYTVWSELTNALKWSACCHWVKILMSFLACYETDHLSFVSYNERYICQTKKGMCRGDEFCPKYSDRFPRLFRIFFVHKIRVSKKSRVRPVNIGCSPCEHGRSVCPRMAAIPSMRTSVSEQDSCNLELSKLEFRWLTSKCSCHFVQLSIKETFWIAFLLNWQIIPSIFLVRGILDYVYFHISSKYVCSL